MKEKKSPLSKAMSLAVRTRNAMPKYGPEWRKKIAQKANKASQVTKKAKKVINS